MRSQRDCAPLMSAPAGSRYRSYNAAIWKGSGRSSLALHPQVAAVLKAAEELNLPALSTQTPEAARAAAKCPGVIDLGFCDFLMMDESSCQNDRAIE